MTIQPSTIILIVSTAAAIVVLLVWGNFYRKEEELIFSKKWYPPAQEFTPIKDEDEYALVCCEISRLRKDSYAPGNSELIDKYVAACVDYCNRTGI